MLDNEELTYIISHDLHEPVRMIGSYMKLLDRKYGNKLDKEANDYLKYAVDGANRLKAMLDDLLDYTRLKKEDVKLTNLNLNELLESVKVHLNTKHNGNDYEIKFNPGSLPEIKADKKQFALLFLNIIDNSLKFNKDARKEVIINVEKKDGDIYFCVSDNGLGIDEQYYDKIFKIFQKLHNNTDYKGSGIGLALCRKIIENHDGKIWIDSVPGKGTKVFFKLPN